MDPAPGTAAPEAAPARPSLDLHGAIASSGNGGTASPPGTQQPPPPPSPPAQPTQPRQNAPTPGPGQAPPPAAAGQPAPTPTQAAAQEWNLRQALAGMGFSGQYESDQAAWAAMQPRLNELSQLAQYGQYFLTNRGQFEQALAAHRAAQAGQQAPAAAPPAKAGWWQAPDYDPAWERVAEYDPATDSYKVPFGYDPAIGPKMKAWREFTREKLQTFLKDPVAMLKPGLEELVNGRVEQLLADRLRAYDEERFSHQYLGGAREWMFAQDPQTGGPQVTPQFDPRTGQYVQRPVMSPAGQSFARWLQYVASSGVGNSQTQAALAERLALADAFEQLLTAARANGGVVPGFAPAAPPNPAPPPGGGPPPGVDPNAWLKSQALGLGGASRLSGTGAQGPGTPPVGTNPDVPEQGQDRRVMRGRISSALRNAAINGAQPR